MNTKKIHVVYIITKLELGGAQKVCLSLFDNIQKNGISTHLISGTKGPLAQKVANSKEVYLLDSMTQKVSFFTIIFEWVNFVRLFFTLYKLRKIHPHLMVHTHSTKAGLIGRWAAFFARVPIRVHTIHGYGFHHYQSYVTWFSIYLLELLTSFITTHFICVAAHDVKIGIRLFPRFARKHSIIRAGIQWNQFFEPAQVYRTPSTKTNFIFGTISCFKPQKNIFDLLQAFETVYLAEPRARLEIIGDGMQRTRIERWITEHHLEKAIILHGWQSNVAPTMKKWQAFVLSSLWEGLPCAVIEARLLHLPVISYDVGGISEVIAHEQNGLLCHAKDITQLTFNMKRTMHEQVLYQNMQQYNDHLEDFNAKNMVNDHIDLYKKLLNYRL